MEVVDYAYPCMMADRALKEAHTAVLERDYDKAIEHTMVALAETKLMLSALKDMKEKAF